MLKRLAIGLLLFCAMLFCGHTLVKVQRRTFPAAALTTEVRDASALLQIGLSSFRGILCEVLWFRISALQQEDRYAEIVPLTDWLTRLDPRSTGAWIFNAWNLAYNISIMYGEPAKRWSWVERGLNLLKEGALAWNPGTPELYAEIGWVYEHKLGTKTDPAHVYYRETLASRPIDYDPAPIANDVLPSQRNTPEAYAYYWYTRAGDDVARLRMQVKLLANGVDSIVPAFVENASYLIAAQSDPHYAERLVEVARNVLPRQSASSAALLRSFIQEHTHD